MRRTIAMIITTIVGLSMSRWVAGKRLNTMHQGQNVGWLVSWLAYNGTVRILGGHTWTEHKCKEGIATFFL